MFLTFKKATLAAACVVAMAQPVFAADDKNPAYDQNSLTVNDVRGNCVITQWMGMDGVCGGEPVQEVAEPAPVAAPVPAQNDLASNSNLWRIIYFDFDSAALTAESKEKLSNLYKLLVDESQQVLRANIVGYTDEIGTNNYNAKLSEERAQAVHAHLQGLGYQDSNVTAVRALGERSSADRCPTTQKRKERIECLWEDRRVEIELEYQNKAK